MDGDLLTGWVVWEGGSGVLQASVEPQASMLGENMALDETEVIGGRVRLEVDTGFGGGCGVKLNADANDDCG